MRSFFDSYFNIILHFIYGNNDIFLFSQHWVFLIFILLGIIFSSEPQSKIIYSEKILCLERIICYTGGLFVIIWNIISMYKIIRMAQFKYSFIFLDKKDLIIIISFYISALLITFCIFIILTKKYKKYLYFLSVVGSIFILQFCYIKVSTFDMGYQFTESLDNVTFNIEGFNKQIIYFNNDLFIGNRNIPIIEDYEGRLYEYDNIIFAESSSGYNFKITASNNKLYMEDYLGKRLIYDTSSLYVNNFYIFGMGMRNKYILYKDELTSKYSLLDYENKEKLYKNLNIEEIDPINYQAKGNLEDGTSFRIHETEKSILIEIGQTDIILEDDIKINIPDFKGQNKELLKILFNEVMVNITKDGPKPNFITYSAPFYRDAAIVAMVCQKTDNLDQILPWISTITEPYDMQRVTVAEPDNLGQVLYLQSLLKSPNTKLINEIIEEAYRLRREPGILSGLTDGAELPLYQTAWLKFGLESLGKDSSDWSLPDNIQDPYIDTMWFYDCIELEEYKANHEFYYNSAWQYLNYARAHFYNFDLTEIDKNNNEYPLSYEVGAYSNELEELLPQIAALKLSTPHSWGAAEMFLYYYMR